MKITTETLKKSFGLKATKQYQSLPDIFYQPARAQAIETPHMVWVNNALAEEQGLTLSEQNPLWSRFFTGQCDVEDLSSIAQAYAGHQYGHFTVLGDGRAVLLCEHTHQGRVFDVHLKGSGPTPFARRGDGQATLYAMLKEALYSEALHQLGVLTTRTLMVGLTGLKIRREKVHQGAHLIRMASSHLRVGTFEWAAMHHDKTHLKALLAFAIERHDPDLTKDDALGFFKRVTLRQASLIAHWQSLGFVHGVMNTDNMAVSGETIDYGPCAFLDVYKPEKTFSSIDAHGRYAYHQQPYIASWNLARLGVALLPLLGENKAQAIDDVTKVLESFGPHFEAAYLKHMAAKFGFTSLKEEETIIINQFLALMQRHQRDFTLSFLDLTYQRFDEPFYHQKEVQDWLVRYQKTLHKHPDAKRLMHQHNPALIPRNVTVDRLLKKAEEGDFGSLFEYIELLKNPYLHTDSQKAHAHPPMDNPSHFVTHCGT